MHKSFECYQVLHAITIFTPFLLIKRIEKFFEISDFSRATAKTIVMQENIYIFINMRHFI